MFAPSGGERFECALNDPLAADINPRTSSHLSVHDEAKALETVEFRVVRPVTDKIGICDQNPWRFVMCPEFSHRFPRLDEKRFIIFQFAQRSDNRVEGFRSEERRVGKECRSRLWPYH